MLHPTRIEAALKYCDQAVTEAQIKHGQLGKTTTSFLILEIILRFIAWWVDLAWPFLRPFLLIIDVLLGLASTQFPAKSTPKKWRGKDVFHERSAEERMKHLLLQDPSKVTSLIQGAIGLSPSRSMHVKKLVQYDLCGAESAIQENEDAESQTSFSNMQEDPISERQASMSGLLVAEGQLFCSSVPDKTGKMDSITKEPKDMSQENSALMRAAKLLLEEPSEVDTDKAGRVMSAITEAKGLPEKSSSPQKESLQGKVKILFAYIKLQQSILKNLSLQDPSMVASAIVNAVGASPEMSVQDSAKLFQNLGQGNRVQKKSHTIQDPCKAQIDVASEFKEEEKDELPIQASFTKQAVFTADRAG